MAKNICKFSTPLISASLYISRFIFETSEEAMKEPHVLEENRVFLITKGECCFDINVFTS